jgi:phosphoribosylformylglycinamidine cyclo-ligase
LIRKVLERSGDALDSPLAGATLGEALLAPTRIYVRALLATAQAGRVHALAHITGGGLTENLPRVLPKGTRACIDTASWPRPEVFAWLQEAGDIAEAEMLRTFNCGIGMVAVAAASEVAALIEEARAAGIEAWEIGAIEPSEDGAPGVAYAA